MLIRKEEVFETTIERLTELIESVKNKAPHALTFHFDNRSRNWLYGQILDKSPDSDLTEAIVTISTDLVQTLLISRRAEGKEDIIDLLELVLKEVKGKYEQSGLYQPYRKKTDKLIVESQNRGMTLGEYLEYVSESMKHDRWIHHINRLICEIKITQSSRINLIVKWAKNAGDGIKITSRFRTNAIERDAEYFCIELEKRLVNKEEVTGILHTNSVTKAGALERLKTIKNSYLKRHYWQLVS